MEEDLKPEIETINPFVKYLTFNKCFPLISMQSDFI